MTNGESNDQNKQNSNTAIRAAELAVFGEVISTVGDVVSTIAAALALEEERQEEIDSQKMQKQLDDLANEVKKLKKQVNSGKPWRS